MTAVEDHEIGRLLGMTPMVLAEVVGGCWWQLETRFTPPEPPNVQWFFSGKPAQVLLGVNDLCGVATVATPNLTWYGHEPRYEVGETIGEIHFWDQKSWPELTRAVDECARIRRATFVYCRYCRELIDPGHIRRDDMCMGCATRYLGVVY